MSAIVRQLNANLQGSISTGAYDQTKTSALGRVFQKVIGSQTVMGPPLTKFIDTLTDLGITPNMFNVTPNGRLFIASTPAAGTIVVSLYDFDLTGQAAPVAIGKINVLVANAAATTHTLKFFKVYDGTSSATVTGWKIAIGTSASVLINGGLFVVNAVTKAQFSILSAPTIGMAIASNANAVYFQQDSAAVGVNNTLTAFQGGLLDRTTQKIYAHNNVLATHQYAVFDLSVAPTISIQTTTSPTVSGNATFTLTGHGYQANDPVVLLTNVPTAFTATTATVQTVYFVRNPTANTFELSATSGGASILATSVATGTTVARAFGTSTSQFANVRTGTISGVAGTILNSNCENYCVPTNAHPNVNGQPCGFFATSTGFYLFKLSDVTNGATTFPSLVSVNVSGTGIDHTSILPLQAVYSTALAQVVYVSNVNVLYAKNWVNSALAENFGGTITQWLETVMPASNAFASVTNTGLAEQSGWLFAASSTTGQRGVLYCDQQSDTAYGYSSIITKVLPTAGMTLQNINQIEALFNLTNVNNFFVRTAPTSGDAMFSSATGSWVSIAEAISIGMVLDKFTQFKIEFYIVSPLGGTPAQVQEFNYSVRLNTDMSDQWAIVGDGTTQNGVTPADTIYELRVAYASVVPTLTALDVDKTTKNVVSTLTTAANPTNFAYSTDGGVSYSPLGTIPNVVGTRLRVRRTLPGGTEAYTSLQDP